MAPISHHAKPTRVEQYSSTPPGTVRAGLSTASCTDGADAYFVVLVYFTLMVVGSCKYVFSVNIVLGMRICKALGAFRGLKCYFYVISRSHVLLVDRDN